MGDEKQGRCPLLIAGGGKLKVGVETHGPVGQYSAHMHEQEEGQIGARGQLHAADGAVELAACAPRPT